MHHAASLARSLTVVLVSLAAVIGIAVGPARADVLEDGWISSDGRRGSGSGLLLHHVWQGSGSEPTSVHWAGALVPSTVVPSVPDALATDLWCIESGVLADPSASYAWSTDSNARASYLLWLADHGWDTPGERAAIHYLLYADAYPERGWNTDAHDMAALIYAHDEFTAPARDAVALFRELTSFTNSAGPLTTTASGIPSTGELAGVGVTDAWGRPVSGLTFTATITGPAVFDATGTSTVSDVTGEAMTSLAWTATDAGEVSFAVDYADAAPGGLTVGSSIAQDYVGGTGFTDLTASTGPVTTKIDFQPGGTSQVTDAVVGQGSVLSDSFVPAAIAGTEWQTSADGTPVPVIYTVAAYALGDTAPASANDSPPAGAVPVATASVVATAPGEMLDVDLGVAPEPGFYTFVWSVARADQSDGFRDYIRADWDDGYGLPGETMSVLHEAEVSTEASTRSTSHGTFLVDEVFLDGFPSDHGDWEGTQAFSPDAGTVTLTLLFFAEGASVTDDNIGAAELVGSIALPAENGHYPAVGSPDFRALIDADGIEIPGTYVFVTSFEGDDRVAPFTTSVEDVHEQVEVGLTHAGPVVTDGTVPHSAAAAPTLAETGVDWMAVVWIVAVGLTLAGALLRVRARRG